MRGFDQKNPHHTMDLFEHCKYASRLFCTKYSYPARFRIGALYHDLGKLSTQTFDEKWNGSLLSASLLWFIPIYDSYVSC